MTKTKPTPLEASKWLVEYKALKLDPHAVSHHNYKRWLGAYKAYLTMHADDLARHLLMLHREASRLIKEDVGTVTTIKQVAKKFLDLIEKGEEDE